MGCRYVRSKVPGVSEIIQSANLDEMLIRRRNGFMTDA